MCDGLMVLQRERETDRQRERDCGWSIEIERFSPQNSVSIIKFTYMILSHDYCEDEMLKIKCIKVLVNCKVSFRYKIYSNKL